MTDNATVAPAKRGPGRPKGSRNKPRPTPKPPTGITPEAPPAPPDDVAAAAAAAPESLIDELGKIAGPRPSADGGRPTARQSAMSSLADQIATSYKATAALIRGAAGMLSIAQATAPYAVRLSAVAAELDRNADACGRALARYAADNPKVAAALRRMTGGAGLMMVVAVHAPILTAAFGASPELGNLAAVLLAPGAPAADDGPVDVASIFASIFTGAGPVANPATSGAPSDPVVSDPAA